MKYVFVNIYIFQYSGKTVHDPNFIWLSHGLSVLEVSYIYLDYYSIGARFWNLLYEVFIENAMCNIFFCSFIGTHKIILLPYGIWEIFFTLSHTAYNIVLVT